MKILIVEDDILMLEALTTTLEKEGYEVESASDGGAALEMIQKQEINLVISDLMMPNITGLGLLSTLRSSDFKRIPVILISALDHASHIVSSLGLGHVECLIKPFNFDELIAKVKKLQNV